MPDSVPSSNASAAAVSSYTSHTSANALDHNPGLDHAAAAAAGPGTTAGSVAVGPTCYNLKGEESQIRNSHNKHKNTVFNNF